MVKQYFDLRLIIKRQRARALDKKYKKIAPTEQRLRTKFVREHDKLQGLQRSKYGDTRYLQKILKKVHQRREYLVSLYPEFARNKSTEGEVLRREEFLLYNDRFFFLDTMDAWDVDPELPLRQRMEEEFEKYLLKHPIEELTLGEFELLVDRHHVATRKAVFERFEQKELKVRAQRSKVSAAQAELNDVLLKIQSLSSNWPLVLLGGLWKWSISRKSLNFASFGFGSIFSVSFLSVFSFDVPDLCELGLCWGSEEIAPLDSPVQPVSDEDPLQPIQLKATQIFPSDELPVHWVESSSQLVLEGFSGTAKKLNELRLSTEVCSAKYIAVVGAASASGTDQTNRLISQQRSENLSARLSEMCAEYSEQVHFQLAMRSPNFAKNDGIQRQIFVFELDIDHISQDVELNSYMSELAEQIAPDFGIIDYRIWSRVNEETFDPSWSVLE